MLIGCDISGNNKNWNNIINDGNNAFVIIKATEGRTYVNPYMKMQTAAAIAAGKLIGFYHFARPENGNTAKQEAENFIKAVKPYIGSAILVLDYEGKAHGCGQAWAVAFIKAVKAATGVLPMFYTSESYLRKYDKVAVTNAGLWVAKYSNNKPKITPWKIMALWQYRSYPYDKSRFYGTAKTWQAYARAKK